jgi:AraC-like DNA-binding protein
VNKGNFSVYTVQKAHTSVAASKNTFYADYKICLALEGEAVWEIEERCYTITPGDIVFLNIGQQRQFTRFGPQGFRLGVFTLKRNAFQNMHHFLFLLELIRQQKNVLRHSTLSALLQSLYDEWDTEMPFPYELASARLTEFFIKAEQAFADTLSPAGKIDREMPVLMDYIDANVSGEISLDTVAKKAGMSPSAFSRRFSAVNGISFKQYLVERKIERAIFLLRTTDRKMIAIAQDCGFDSISGFYSAFRKITGTTPSKFSETEKAR